jgi:hypothetical protein
MYVRVIHSPLTTYQASLIRYHLSTHARTHSLTHPLTHPLTHSLTYSPTHLLTHPLAYQGSHPLTHSLTKGLITRMALPRVEYEEHSAVSEHDGRHVTVGAIEEAAPILYPVPGYIIVYIWWRGAECAEESSGNAIDGRQQ